MESTNNIGNQMHGWAKDLFPICRSLTGPGVRDTLHYIQNLINELEISSVPSETPVFDWVVPDEWTIRDAFIDDSAGNRLINFKKNNLHVVGYSEPVDLWLTLEELKHNLHSLPEQPDAIPYITSYYSRCWGFCMTHEQFKSLEPGLYHVVIDSDLRPGTLNYGEVIIPGELDKEIFLSTYICHPSLANNELSGPVVTTALVQWLKSINKRRYTYRIIFIPETIGSIVYLSKNIEYLKKHVVAGFNITCVGDDRSYSYLPSRNGKTLSDYAAINVLEFSDLDYKSYSWLERGSDERQYCAPGVDLPIASIMRSKYGTYPEYHTSLDDLNLVTPSGLEGGYYAIRKAIEIIEYDFVPESMMTCEPQLGKRGLYPNLSNNNTNNEVRDMMNLLSYCDGKHTLLEIAKIINTSFFGILPIARMLIQNNIIKDSTSNHTN
jgi:aminopeptidase-like protein